MVLKKFSIDTGEYRISLYDTPIILAGVIAGPLWGMVVAFCADFLYSLLFIFKIGIESISINNCLERFFIQFNSSVVLIFAANVELITKVKNFRVFCVSFKRGKPLKHGKYFTFWM